VPTSELARDGRIIDTGINFAPGAQAEHGVSRTNAARNRVAGHSGALPHAGFLPAQTARAPDGWLGSSLQASAARTRAPNRNAGRRKQLRQPPDSFCRFGSDRKTIHALQSLAMEGTGGWSGCATSVLQGLIMPEVQALIRANLRLGDEHAVCVPGARPHPAAFPWRVISRVLRHSRVCRI
jgi:hypothetical protein